MTDIVERLMNRHCCQDNLDQEAAKEIERLREENKQLREKLEPYLAAEYRLNEMYNALRKPSTKGERASKWKCPMGYASCKESCGNYGCGN